MKKRKHSTTPDMLEGVPEEVVEMISRLHDVLGALLPDDTATAEYTPPPPGDTRDQLPDHILALIVPRPYISTACETAQAVESAVIRHPEHRAELMYWRDRMHDWCQINNEFTGLLCECPHHQDEDK